MDCSPPGSSVHRIVQARILEWVAIPPSGNLPDPGTEPESLVPPALAGGFFTTVPSNELPFSNMGKVTFQIMEAWDGLHIFL